MKKVLVQRVSNPNPNGGQGDCGENETLVLPGTVFTGKEGRLASGGRTGWGEPRYWLEEEAAVEAVANCIWDDGYDSAPGWEMSQARAVVKRYLCDGPEAFPGLAEHYPQFATQAVAPPE